MTKLPSRFQYVKFLYDKLYHMAKNLCNISKRQKVKLSEELKI